MNKQIVKFILSIFILLFTVLAFFSLLPGHDAIANDYNLLIDSELSFVKIITLNFPKVSNFIGPIGVFISFFFITLFGNFLSMCLLFALFLYNFTFMLKNLDRDLFAKKILFFINFVFWGNLLLFRTPVFFKKSGIIINSFNNFFLKILGELGSLLTISVFFIISIFSLIGFEKVHEATDFLLKKIFAFFLFFLTSVRNLKKIFVRKPKKKKPKKIKKEKISKQKNLPKELPIVKDDLEEMEERLHLDEDEKEKKETEKISYDEETGEILELKEDFDINNGLDEDSKVNIKQSPPTIEEFDKLKEKLEKEDNNTSKQENESIHINTQKEFETYEMPDIDHFLNDEPKRKTVNQKDLRKNIEIISRQLEDKLAEFNISAKVINVNIGPIISQYELEPAPGIKVSKFSSLINDLALAVKARSIRIQAPIPGKGLIGVEIPNKDREIIYMKNVILSKKMKEEKSKLAIVLGKNIVGNPVISDLSKMPHLLIAGATGSGKSVCINTLIISLILLNSPEDLRLIMIDPKRIELSPYEGIPHLAHEIITNPDNALATFKWAVSEMEHRYEKLQKTSTRDIKIYNSKVDKEDKLPYLVIIVDEYADLLMTAGKDIEMPIARLAQKARAVGIHLILATQRPSTKVITGIIKANFPSRIAFRVSSKIDSRVILDINGAERLLGRGDMLFLPPGSGFTERIHGAYVSDDEIENIIEFLKKQPKPQSKIEINDSKIQVTEFEYDDELFPQAAESIVRAGTASVSMLQRQFKVGYARAGRLIDMLERAGIVGEHQGSKPREVLASMEDLRDNGIC